MVSGKKGDPTAHVTMNPKSTVPNVYEMLGRENKEALVNMNDNEGATFNQIAAWVEINL